MIKVRATKLENSENNVIGLASMVVDGKFAFNSMRVVATDNNERGYFVSMPTFKAKDGTYVDIFKPLNAEIANSLAEAVGKSMEDGNIHTIGSGETKITTYVEPVNYKESSQVAKVSLRAGDIICNSISIRKSDDGNMFIGYPSYKNKDGEYVNFCNPTTKEFKDELQESIIKQYGIAMDKKYSVDVTEKTSKDMTANISAPSR